MDENPPLPSELEPIPGDTYPLRAELKTLGAIWDSVERLWRITADKLPLAIALVENQPLMPTATLLSTDASGELIDPFEQEAQGSRLIALEKREGATYEARDALRAVGARWDKDRRAWVIREERADYARAVLTARAAAPASPPATTPPFRSVDAERSIPKAATRATAPAPPPVATTPLLRATVREVSRNAYQTPEPTTSQEATRPMATDRIKLGGLWLNRSKDGREYLTGKLSPTVKILIFKNDFKTTDNQPSHVMYLAPVEQEETQRQNPPAPPNSFFGATDVAADGADAADAADTAGDFEGAGGGDEADSNDFFPEDEAPPLPAPGSRSSRSGPAPGGASTGRAENATNHRPTGGARSVPPNPGPRRPANGTPPSSPTPPRPREVQAARDDSDMSDLGDPFDE